MLRVLVSRAGQMAFVMAGISILVFLIFFATPGTDPAARIAGRNASPEVLAAVRHAFGFDQPLYVQYLLLMKRLFITGDLTSFVNRGQRVIPSILQAVPVTLSLVFGAAVVWVTLSILIGVVAGVWRGTLVDRVLMILGLIGISMPVFWVGEVANLITQSRFHDSWLFSWVPGLGYVPADGGSDRMVQGAGDSLVQPRDPLCRALRPGAAREPDRVLPGGLHPDRARQGPRPRPASSSAMRCARRSSPSCRCSGSISGSWSGAGRF